MSDIKVGVLGTGHLGTHHTRILSTLPGAELIGIHDPDEQRMKSIGEKYHTKTFSDLDELLDLCDAVIIASPTSTHRAVGEIALKAGCHLFIEKPITENASEGRALIALADKLNKIVMIGHVEQFNPAFSVARDLIKNPKFVESHRLTQFRGRGTDVTVVHDLLIHDLEILVSLVNSDIITVDTSAQAILTETPDIANSRLKFDNGCVANLTASRISITNMRKMRFFQPGAYISVDFGERVVEVASLGDKANICIPDKADKLELPNGDAIYRWNVPVPDQDALTEEQLHFLDCIRNHFTPRTSGIMAIKALELADRITEKV